MDIVLVTTDSEDNEYQHNPTPGIIITSKTTHQTDTDTYTVETVTWEVTGILLPGTNDLSVDEQVFKLEAFYSESDISKVQMKVDNAVLEEMPSDNGIRLLSFDFPVGQGPEWATRRRYHLTFESERFSDVVKDTGDYEYVITYTTKQNNNKARAITGSLEDMTNNTASEMVEALIVTNGWRELAGYNIISEQVVDNRVNSRSSFSIMHEEYFQAYPTSITNANVQTETRVDKQNIQRSRTSGWFEGETGACLTAINTLVGSNKIVSQSITRDDYAYRTSFNIEMIDLGDGTIVYQQETIAIQDQVTINIYKPVLGGANPIKQATGKTSATASQTGTIKQFDTWAEAPALRWNAEDVSSRDIVKVGPEWNLSAGSYMYVTNYTIQYEFVTTPTFT
jgi:hypothetical protein